MAVGMGMAMVTVTVAKRTTRAIGDCNSSGGDNEDNGGNSAGRGHKQQSTK